MLSNFARSPDFTGASARRGLPWFSLCSYRSCTRSHHVRSPARSKPRAHEDTCQCGAMATPGAGVLCNLIRRMPAERRSHSHDMLARGTNGHKLRSRQALQPSNVSEHAYFPRAFPIPVCARPSLLAVTDVTRGGRTSLNCTDVPGNHSNSCRGELRAILGGSSRGFPGTKRPPISVLGHKFVATVQSYREQLIVPPSR